MNMCVKVSSGILSMLATHTMKAINAFADVNSYSTISQLVAKLPAFGVNAWKKLAAAIYRENREPNLIDFIKFVKDLAERESHAYSNILTLKQKQSRQKDSSYIDLQVKSAFCLSSIMSDY